MSNDIVIWGTGRIGSIAFFYYKDISNIVCYIDNDERKWGKILNGVKICSPDILKNQSMKVVLAIKKGVEDVRKQLDVKYGIKNSVLFQINQELYSLEKQNSDVEENVCIVFFAGGLGNQMFQYAFLKNLQYHGKKVLAYLNSNIETTSFHLLDVFKNINLEMCTEAQKISLIEKNVKEAQKAKKFVLYIEESINEVKENRADLSIVNRRGFFRLISNI